MRKLRVAARARAPARVKAIPVIPAKAGIQTGSAADPTVGLDPGLRGGDGTA